MAATAHELKNAAIKAHAELVVRVKGPQGGVPTFFDNFFGQLLHRLMTTEAMHGWDAQREMAPGSADSQASASELRWLSRFLDVRGRGRFVPYSVRLARGKDRKRVRHRES
jgi:hypothetical protein